jgi:hypothetical protein
MDEEGFQSPKTQNWSPKRFYKGQLGNSKNSPALAPSLIEPTPC